MLTGAAYVLLTAFALAFQPLDTGSIGGADPAGSARRIIGASYGNLQAWLVHRGLEASPLMVVLPAAVLLATGLWVWKRRATDPWNLIGVVAIAARTGWYHRMYDDLLILLPVIALLRIGTRRAHGEDDLRRAPAILVAIACIAAGLVPARLHTRGYPVTSLLVNTATLATWLAALVLLDREAKRTSRGATTPPPH